MGCRWKRLLKPFENFVKKKIRPHPAPGDPAEGSPGPHPDLPKTDFFQFKPNIANGVSTEASAQAC